MSGNFWLDWALFTVSLYNTILLLWLGLTVLLNAEHRSWGLWLAGGGLLVSAGFFVSHTVILSRSLMAVTQSTELWWRVGWTTLVGLPFSWYVLMLWYSGFWREGQAILDRRQRPWLLAMAVGTGLLLAAMLATQALPGYQELLLSGFPFASHLKALPWPIVVYPFYSVLCSALSLRALAHPLPSARPFGDAARQRARPWLVGTSLALLLVSLMVAFAVGGVAVAAMEGGHRLDALFVFGRSGLASGIAWFDLVVALLIAGAVVCLGQAIVAYEIFTGQSLPRRGFSHHWRRAVILAAGYSVVVGWSLAAQLGAIYGLLLTAMVMTVFYAMLVWRSFADRQRTLAQLRPFMGSPQLRERLVSVDGAEDLAEGRHFAAKEAFVALCADILGARTAMMVPVGTSAALVGEPLVYPLGAEARRFSLHALAGRLQDSGDPATADPAHRPRHAIRRTTYVEVDPERYGGAAWAVALWQEAGLDGIFLLGPKVDGGLYTEEEIELAQAAGERLLDLQVSAEMGRRMMALQRQRLAETQIADQRVRRALHDDILPEIHAAMLELSGRGDVADIVALLSRSHRRISDLLREMPAVGAPEVARLGLVGALRRVVAGELVDAFDGVIWEIDPKAEARARDLPGLSLEVVFFAAREVLRNAARHGRGLEPDEPLTATLSLSAAPLTGDFGGLMLRVQDDGAGMAPILHSEAGSGQGLALHSTMMVVIGGSLEVRSSPDQGTCVTLMLPVPSASPSTTTRSV